MLSRRLLRIKALKALYAHIQCEGDNLIAAQKRLFESIDKTYDLYFLLLQLPAQMAQYELARQQTAREKHLATYEDLNPNRKFVEAQLIQMLSTSDALNDRLTPRKLNWNAHNELVKTLYQQLSKTERFKAYMESGENAVKEDVELLEYFYVEVLQQNEDVEAAVEELSIDMSGELSFVLPLVIRTLSNVKQSHTDIKAVKMFKSDEDKDFVKELLQKAIVNYAEHQKYIEKYTSNWDLERVVYMDNMIMVVAMAEMIQFSDIPVKVTMDEFIEIAKDYSTPGSSQFVNGILDKVTAALQDEGRIVKSQRGLR